MWQQITKTESYIHLHALTYESEFFDNLRRLILQKIDS